MIYDTSGIWLILLLRTELSRPYPCLGKERGRDTRLRLLNLLYGHWWAHFIYKSKRNETSSTTTVMVFKCLVYTCLSPIYLYLHKLHYYKNFYIYILKPKRKTYIKWTPIAVLALTNAEYPDVLFNTYTDETLVLSL